jgi:hypothetical protein
MTSMSGNSGVIETITAAFAFLTDRFGFELGDSSAGERESHVRYTSSAARVMVLVDHLPLAVNTAVGLFYERTPGCRLVDEYGLLALVEDRDPGEADRLRGAEDSLQGTLKVHADLLARHGADLLRGETGRIPRLRRARARATREENKALFGTSTGETPRFSSRPSLEELFADAANDGMRTARAYQAFWDYNFALAEVADFLGETEDAVQARLDEWDRL